MDPRVPGIKNLKIFPILEIKIKNLKILGFGKVFDKKSLNKIKSLY